MTNGTQRSVERPIYPGYRFYVEIDSISEAAFSECSGLTSEIEMMEHEEGGENGFKHRLLVRTKYPNLVLKRGIGTAALWNWYSDITVGLTKGQLPTRKTLTVVIAGYAGDRDQTPAIRYSFSGVLPVKWVGPTLKTGASETAIETLELIHEGFTRV